MRFRDFESAEDRIRIFENPFAIKIETLPTELQLEDIELILNNNFKDYFKESSLQQFYAMLPEESFPNLKKHAREMIKNENNSPCQGDRVMLLILSTTQNNEFARNEDLHDGFFASKTPGYNI
ncbi:hypothetical protein QTP88_018416 [Uroleucon formosanum]